MSRHPDLEPRCDTDGRLVIEPRTRNIGAFEVRRVLPAAKRRTVGPFIFLDEMGPTELAPGGGMDVRPHPHIGLATLTYLFEGQILHHDSLGVKQLIRPGAVNWMVAGRGVAHSERTPPELRERGTRVHGLQLWVALPEATEEIAPYFLHHDAADIPTAGSARVIVGRAYGVESPVETLSPTLYVHAELEPGSELDLPDGYEELALYLVSGSIDLDGERFDAARMIILDAARPRVRAVTAARVMLLGGDPIGPRHIWWNFVSSSRERIEQAKADWKAGRFAQVPGEDDLIPLPER
jgi:redox-sensitive bicupin YhaK (pirin superfamily)